MPESEFTGTANGKSGAAAFDEVEVDLRFELGHRSIQLRDLAALAPGTVIELGRPLADAVVSLWVERQCLGTGQLVAVGENLGLRLSTMFGDASVTAASLDATVPASDAAEYPDSGNR